MGKPPNFGSPTHAGRDTPPLAHWRTALLGEIADLTWGDTSTTKASYVESGFPAYSASGRDGYLPHADFRRTGVVLSAIGANCGKTWLAKGDWSCIKNTLRFWSTDAGVDTEFLYWATIDPEFWPKRGSAQPFISQGDARGVRVTLPPLGEQRAIARVLGALDDRIELNRRMSETLEEMARALFRSWFVDFDPVRAKAEGRPSGLPPDLDALFPASFEASELGEIPAGWEVIPAGEAMTVHGGSTPSTKEPSYWGGDHCFATPKDLSTLQEPLLGSTARHLTDVGVARIRSGLLPPGTILLSSRAPIGYLAVTETPVVINQGVVAMVCDGPVGASYALHWSRSNMYAIEARASGTTFAEISKSSFRDIPFLVPPEPVHATWETLVAPMYEFMGSNARQSHGLAEQRDALLPRLVSGELLGGVRGLSSLSRGDE